MQLITWMCDETEWGVTGHRRSWQAALRGLQRPTCPHLVSVVSLCPTDSHVLRHRSNASRRSYYLRNHGSSPHAGPIFSTVTSSCHIPSWTRTASQLFLLAVTAANARTCSSSLSGGFAQQTQPEDPDPVPQQGPPATVLYRHWHRQVTTTAKAVAMGTTWTPHCCCLT